MFVTDLSFSNFSYLYKILLFASATAMPVVIKLQQQNSQTKEIDIDLHDKHDRHGNQNSEINMYEHLKVKPDGNLNVPYKHIHLSSDQSLVQPCVLLHK
jgi:hypothetical protein